jgi:hypothetical protein
MQASRDFANSRRNVQAAQQAVNTATIGAATIHLIELKMRLTVLLERFADAHVVAID